MYRVTVTKLEVFEFPETSYKQVSDKGNERDGGPTYAYIPNGKVERQVKETELLQQIVQEIDMPVVIAAINGMKLAGEPSK